MDLLSALTAGFLHIGTNAHIPESKWTGVMGEFFDEDGQYLICATHGAMFDPEDGKCVNGPCVNQRLISIPVKLEGDAIYVLF